MFTTPPSGVEIESENEQPIQDSRRAYTSVGIISIETQQLKRRLTRGTLDIPPDAINLHGASAEEQYRYVLSQLDDLYALYDSRQERADAERDKNPVQWPVERRNNVKVIMACKCRIAVQKLNSITGKRLNWHRGKPHVRPAMIRCYDPGCTVAAGWHHEACLSEEERRNKDNFHHFVCSACITRRLFEGFEELYSSSLRDDNYQRVVRAVCIWRRKEKADGAQPPPPSAVDRLWSTGS
ncbi:uncharacterized protein AB675_2507 [Cyphellophora attinorum]|uniref:Uncharacterized protein n=1 Tax=Cyphellophora attinorum TaxID=1664694 RepID=A0A0N1P2H4_9EURO|nr:uncharacterized protein AB675_2507 [Phialophora attinorum]KPI45296.1 hypothetical protein AB675_2507 [Phialophora attinorum]